MYGRFNKTKRLLERNEIHYSFTCISYKKEDGFMDWKMIVLIVLIIIFVIVPGLFIMIKNAVREGILEAYENLQNKGNRNKD